MSKISYLKLNMLYLTVCASFWQDQLFLAVFTLPLKNSHGHSRTHSRFRDRVNYKHGGRMSLAIVGYLTIYWTIAFWRKFNDTQRNNGDIIIKSSTNVSFESSATVEPRQCISKIYIYLYVSDQSVFIGSK